MWEIIVWIVVGLFGLLVLFGLVIAFIGWSYPVEHTVSRQMQLKQSAQELWNTITDHEKEPEWQPQMEFSKRLPDVDGQEVWQVKYKGAGNPAMTFLRTTFSQPPTKLVGVIADEKKVFDGRWEFNLKPVSAIQLTLTEVARISSPVIRGLYHLFGNPAMYLDQYLKALAAKYNETAEITGL